MNIISRFPEEDNNEKKNIYLPILIVLLSMAFITMAVLVIPVPHKEECPEITAEPIQKVQERIAIVVEAKEDTAELTDDDIIASVVMAEAGNQGMLGKVAVAMTILNRVDYFDKTVEAVVTEPNQYSYPYNGEITEECYRAVEIARNSRDLFPATMMWFRTTDYHKIGEPYMKIQDHYFSYLLEEE